MLETKKDELRAEIARRERELEKLESLPDLAALVDGSVTALFVTHGGSKPYTYVAYLTRAKFYLTGRTSPNGVNADELAEWLTTSGRRLKGAAVLAQVTTEVVEESVFDLAEVLLDGLVEANRPRRSYLGVDGGYGYGD